MNQALITASALLQELPDAAGLAAIAAVQGLSHGQTAEMTCGSMQHT